MGMGLVYVANEGTNTVSVIDSKTHSVIATVPVRNQPNDVAIPPDGKLVYVANKGDGFNSSTVSVITLRLCYIVKNNTRTVPKILI
ncbi:YncE family protein [Cytobacillus sp. Hm23]